MTRSDEPDRTHKRVAGRRPHALGALILRVAAEHDESVGDVARRAGLPRATVYALTRPGATLTQTPRRHTLDSLAAALRIPVWQLETAAATATYGGRGVPEGYRAQPIGEVDGTELALLLPDGATEPLSEDEWAELVEAAREVLRRRRERSARSRD